MDSPENVLQRRDFLCFMGRLGAVAALAPLVPTGANQLAHALGSRRPKEPFRSLTPSNEDALRLAPGFQSQVLIRWGDELGQDLQFGFNNDYLAYFSLPQKDNEGLLWVNHEYLDPYFVKSPDAPERTRSQVLEEQKAVGGSIVHIRQHKGRWEYVKGSAYNRRLDAQTPISFAAGVKVRGSTQAIGTLANCAGGVTPWSTVLTCEENYYLFYGEVDWKSGRRQRSKSSYGWEKYFDQPPEHYGWVVEVNPFTGQAKKLTALGRFAHEGATPIRSRDRRVVVYMGDDKRDECFYKFISDGPNSLEKGRLYVADLEKKKWQPLTLAENPILQKHFKDPLEALIRTREAAHLVGGTPLNRPEDVEIDPVTGDIFLCCTNNRERGDLHGSIYRFREKDGDYLASEFEWEIWLKGGPETGFSAPDNLAFDRKGNMWFTSDMSESRIFTEEYKSFGNNSLFYTPLQGPHSGRVFRVASGPVDCELTGLAFSPDQKTLFLSVQHPGARSAKEGRLTSHWPDGGDSTPRPSVVAIQGPTLERLTEER